MNHITLLYSVILYSPNYNSHWDSRWTILHYCILLYCTPLPTIHIKIQGEQYHIIVFCSTTLPYLLYTLRFKENHITLLYSVLLHSPTYYTHKDSRWTISHYCFLFYCTPLPRIHIEINGDPLLFLFFLSEKNPQGTVEVISSDFPPFVDWHLMFTTVPLNLSCVWLSTVMKSLFFA